MGNNWIVIVGTVANGFAFYGPFSDDDTAREFAEENWHTKEYEVIELESP